MEGHHQRFARQLRVPDYGDAPSEFSTELR